MRDELNRFMEVQRFGVVASQLTNGDPHVATVHYACMSDNLEIIIQTDPASRKYELLAEKGICKASFTTGFEEIKTIAAQFDGILSTDITKKHEDFYLTKFPEKAAKYEHDVFVVFRPTWWRYTDWTKPEGKTIFTSDGNITIIKK